MAMSITEKDTYIGRLSQQGYIFIPMPLVKKMNFSDYVSVKKDEKSLYISAKKDFFGSEGKNIKIGKQYRIYMGRRFLYEYTESGRPVDIKFTYNEDKQIVIATPQYSACVFCGATERLMTFSNKKICKDCFDSLNEMYYNI